MFLVLKFLSVKKFVYIIRCKNKMKKVYNKFGRMKYLLYLCSVKLSYSFKILHYGIRD